MGTAEEDRRERWRIEQEAIGRDDKEMQTGTRLKLGLRVIKPESDGGWTADAYGSSSGVGGGGGGWGDFIIREGTYQGFERRLVGANRHLLLFEGGLMDETTQAAVGGGSYSYKGCEIVRLVDGASGGGGDSRGGGGAGGVLCKVQLRDANVEWEVLRPAVL